MKIYTSRLPLIVVSLLMAMAIPAAQAASDAINILKVTPYSEDSMIAKNIKEECHIQTQLPEFISQYATDKGMVIKLENKVNPKDKGKTLDVEITDAVSRGNAFLGHRKSITIQGTLWGNGSKIGTFKGRRVSGGGFLGGFKGSCSVLGRTIKALGRDVAVWLESPSMNARLGDL